MRLHNGTGLSEKAITAITGTDPAGVGKVLTSLAAAGQANSYAKNDETFWCINDEWAKLHGDKFGITGER